MAEIRLDLSPWQRIVYSDATRFKVIVAGRRCGKTRLSAVTLLTKGIECPAKDARVMYVAPTQGMAYDLMWDLMVDLGQDIIAKAHINDGDITLKNGVKIQIRGADKPDRLRGKKLYYVVMDEMKDIKSGTWENSVGPSLTDMKGGALFIGTPEPEAEEFRKMFDYGESGEDTDWKSWHFTTADNPFIDKAEIEAAKKRMGTAEFLREYEASWDTTGANILRLEWFKTGKAPEGNYSTYIAVDPAGYSGVTTESGKKSKLDYFAIAVVRVYDDGKWWVQKIDYGRWDVRESVVRVLLNIRTHKPLSIGIEKGPLMRAILPYLEDLMRKNQQFAHIEAISTGGIAKENRITYALQGLMEHGRIVFNEDENWDEVKREMLAFPSKRVHDDCFPANAPIITLAGEKPISEVTTDDYVLTGNGEFKKVLKVWCVGMKEVISRYGITATPDHRIFTRNRGWVHLDSLTNDDILTIANTVEMPSCEKPSYSMEETITDTQIPKGSATVDTIHAMTHGRVIQDHYIEIFGNSITGEYLTGITSITKMGTAITTKYQISSAYLAQPTKLPIETKEAKEVNQNVNCNILKTSGALQKHGIHHQKDESGIDNMHLNPSFKMSKKGHALNVENSSSQECQSKKYAEKSVEDCTQIESKGKEMPVYDLMVEDRHEFFAYGTLVHNCLDALAYIQHVQKTSYLQSSSYDSYEYEEFDSITGI